MSVKSQDTAIGIRIDGVIESMPDEFDPAVINKAIEGLKTESAEFKAWMDRIKQIKISFQ